MAARQGPRAEALVQIGYGRSNASGCEPGPLSTIDRRTLERIFDYRFQKVAQLLGGDVPKDDVPKDDVPKDDVPKDYVPKDYVRPAIGSVS